MLLHLSERTSAKESREIGRYWRDTCPRKLFSGLEQFKYKSTNLMGVGTTNRIRYTDLRTKMERLIMNRSCT